jgi:pimeloyl-ACP methyl ester carboxylesterase
MQLAALLGWTSVPWLASMRQPTLIMTGIDDPMIPVINARFMRWLIPDARLELLDCGHLFLITLAEQSAHIVEAFLTEPRQQQSEAAFSRPLSRRMQ